MGYKEEEMVERQGAVDRHGSLVKNVDAAGMIKKRRWLAKSSARDDDQVQCAIRPTDGTTCCGIAAEDDQEKVE